MHEQTEVRKNKRSAISVKYLIKRKRNNFLITMNKSNKLKISRLNNYCYPMPFKKFNRLLKIMKKFTSSDNLIPFLGYNFSNSMKLHTLKRKKKE